jgi:hypothetical protein
MRERGMAGERGREERERESRSFLKKVSRRVQKKKDT